MPSTGATSFGTSRGRHLDISHISTDQTSAELYCNKPPERIETGSICTSLAVQTGQHDGRQDPGGGGGHHQPAQDGASTLLFGCYTILHHHHQDTSRKNKRLDTGNINPEKLIYKEENKEAEKENTCEEETDTGGVRSNCRL